MLCSCDDLDDATSLLDLLSIDGVDSKSTDNTVHTRGTHSANADTHRALTIKGSFGRLEIYNHQYRKCILSMGIDSQALPEDLAVTKSKGVNDGDDLAGLREALLLLLRDERPELVQVHDRLPLDIAGQVESPHTDFTKVTRMVLVVRRTQSETEKFSV